MSDHQQWKGIHRWTRGVHRPMPPAAHAIFLALGLAAAAASSALFLTGIGTGGARQTPGIVLPGTCQYCDPGPGNDGLFLASPPADTPVPLRPSSPAKGTVPRARPAPPTSRPRPSPTMSVCTTPWPSPIKSKRK